ncbi:hypothetical protein PCNPT3_08385 [Psychromonas sp. CNPT3]|uniref:DUF4123 domain-containing protein n=1 Tax=Psychromonas sp. CNPT3 TaxID=314282 RepID=UPI0002C054FD|nr:DUF4123 domain-containing protein [Psychromonas sp. CNPT3]AGH81615.1 hypothetical protein PCNPT3_08385 [Psychromonas sp. CNPT3]
MFGATQQEKQNRLASLQALQPQWLLIDGASCPEPLAYAKGISMEHDSVFNVSDQHLADNGPWLIAVNNNVDLMRHCLTADPQGYGCLWFDSTLTKSALIGQWQQRIYAELPDGTETRFRSYDPRVCHFYLNGSTLERQAEFLAPFERFFYADLNPYFVALRWPCWQAKTPEQYQQQFLDIAEVNT